MDLKFTPKTAGQLQVIITNSPTLDALGYYDKGSATIFFCCVPALVNQLGGACTESNVNQMVNLERYPFEIEKYLVVLDSEASRSLRHSVTSTGTCRRLFLRYVFKR
jgi:hypothetical protein